MTRRIPLLVAALLGTLVLAGCFSSAEKPAAEKAKPAAESKDAKIRAAIEELDPEDRKLAEAQQWCAVQNEKPLGTMGKPVKIMFKEQAVFLCCKSCKKEAEANPDKTLAKVEELKAKHSAAAK
jgi:outer membrane murein-binding lipoprotein Lpp